MSRVLVFHFSDVLCVWAYVSQVRVDELCRTLGDQVSVDVHFCSVFADARGKLEKRWQDRGGLAAYGQHVRTVAEEFPHVVVHPDIWRAAAPASSLPGHVFLAGVRLLEQRGSLDGPTQDGNDSVFRRACWELRVAFFRDARDISQRNIQLEVAESLGLPRGPIEAVLDSGEAYASLGADLDLAREHDVSSSPTLILNEGRQRLNGNVGYRVIAANVKELLAQRRDEDSSWC